MRLKSLLPLAMFIAAPVLPALAQTTIDTRDGPVTELWAVGFPFIGELFTAPSDNVMQTGSLWFGSSSTALFSAVLQEWGPGGLVGPRLYESAVQSMSEVSPTRFDFDLGGVTLVAGTRYAFFAADANQSSGYSQLLGYGSSLTDSYSGGSAMVGDIDQQNEYDVLDQAFVGTFTSSVTSAPEPASVTLLATGLMCILGATRRRTSLQKA